MESTADVVGVDILLFPVEEEEKAPSPSELPMPNFGFQGTIQSDLGQLRGLVCTPVDHFPHSLTPCGMSPCFSSTVRRNLSGCYSLSSMQGGHVLHHV